MIYDQLESNKLTFEANSVSCNLNKRFIALQSLCPQTIICLISFTTQPNSRAAGSFVVNSSKKCCECGITFPALRTVKGMYFKFGAFN